MTTVWIDRRQGKAGGGATPPADATPDATFADLAELRGRRRRVGCRAWRSTPSTRTASRASPRRCRTCGPRNRCSTSSARSGSARRASDERAALVVFPELGLSRVRDRRLLPAGRADRRRSCDAVQRSSRPAAELLPVLVVGGPLRAERGVFNVGFVIHRGRVLGVVPKSYLPNYREYYEERQFRAAREFDRRQRRAAGGDGPVRRRPDLRAPPTCPAWRCTSRSARTSGCRCRRAPTARWRARPCSRTCRASNITVGKADFRRTLCMAQSARTIAAYIYTAAGGGESTTDLAWDGQALICENGDLVAEAERFCEEEQLLLADLDLDRMASDRASTNCYGDSIHDHRERDRALPARRLRARRRPDEDPAAAPDRALPVRPRRPAEPRRALLRGLQHPGPRPRDAPARDRDQEGRDRHLGRAGLDARADRRRARDGPARAAARERPRLHDAGLRDLRAHQGQRLEADGGARRDRARDRHPAVGGADAARPRAPLRRAARSSTTSPSRTSRPASAPRTCSGSPTTTAGS